MLAQPRPPQTTSEPEPPKCPRTSSHIDMRAGTYSSQPGVTFELHPFVAQLVPMSKSAPMCYQRLAFVQHAVIFTSNDSLTNIFAAKLRDSNSKIRDLQIVNGDGTVRLSGSMRELVPIHFAIEGPISTDGVELRMHVQSIKADGIPIKLLLEAVGKNLNALFGSVSVPGIVVEGNTLVFRPEFVAHLKGHIRSAVSSPTGLTLTYGPPPKPTHTR